MKTILYFHGLGSSAASRKFVRLQQVFGHKYQIVCPEWTFTTDIRMMLGNLLTQYECFKSIIIIGSSTGCNFAYQLAENLRLKSVNVNLIMINPLFHLGQRLNTKPFPAKLESYVKAIREVNECTLIVSNADEMIDHSLVKIGSHVKLITIEDNHQVKDLKRLITIIKALLKKNRSKDVNQNTIHITINFHLDKF